MLEKIFFYVISIALFVIIFLKMMRKNNIVYLSSLIIQALGITINFICLILKIKINLVLTLLTYIMSVIIPIFILVCEYNKINLIEKIMLIIAKACIAKNDTKKAKKILIELIEKDEDSKNAHKMLAQLYEKEGGLRKAIDEYVKVVDLDANEHEAYYKIATLLKELGNEKDCQDMLTKLVNKRPDYVDACIALCDILCSQERYKEAVTIMNEAARHNPNNFDIYYNLGMIYTMLNDFPSAKLNYEKAAVINSLEYNTN